MVICHCEYVNDRTIGEVAADGASTVGELTVDDITERCGAGGRCGGCRDSIEQLLQAMRARLDLVAS
jgi:bacterioferritin-associated ferredoxin